MECGDRKLEERRQENYGWYGKNLKKGIKIWSRQYKRNNAYIDLKKEIGKCSLLIKN